MKLTDEELKEMIMQEIAEANEKISTKKTSAQKEWAGKGEDLEIALRDAWNEDAPEVPYFATVAQMLADSIESRYNPGPRSGAIKPGNEGPSTVWKDIGARNNTSKADLNIHQYQLSMKMGPSAMLFGMQAGDAKASMYAAALSAGYGGKTKQGGWADPATAEMMGVLDSMDNKMILAQKGILERSIKLMDENEALIAQQSPEKTFTQVSKGMKEPYPSPQQIKQARGQVEKGTATEGSRKQLQRNLLETVKTGKDLIKYLKEFKNVNKNLDTLETEFIEFLDPETNPQLQLEFFREGLTGRAKFGGTIKGGKLVIDLNHPQIANHFLITQDKKMMETNLAALQANPEAAAGLYEIKPINDRVVRDVAQAGSFRAKVRVDSMKEKVGGKKSKTGLAFMRGSIVAEIKSSTAAGKKYIAEFENKLKTALQEGILVENQLNEFELGAMIKKGWGKLKAAGIKFIKAIFDAFSRIVEFAQSTFSSIFDKVKALTNSAKAAVTKGASGVLSFLGISAKDYVESIDGLEELENQNIPATLLMESQEQKESLTIERSSYNMLVEMIENLMSEE